MPMNKNAVIRYRHIDSCLSHKHKRFTTQEIADYVNEKLREDDFPTVSLRCIQKDIKALTEEVFFADLDYKERADGKKYIHYADPSYSIFTKELSEDEEHLLSEVLNTLGQFDGLNNFEWLDGLKQRLGVRECRRIIQFSANPDYLAGSNLLGKLFTAIANKQVIKITYHTFKEPEKPKKSLVHPYLLKQYNNRWFLIAGGKDDFIINFALDRIDDFELVDGKKYKEPSMELEERFEEIVGVTLIKGASSEKILLWVSDKQMPYIQTKPLHGSQRVIKGARAEQLHKEYGINDGHFIEINCIVNTELKQLIASQMDDMMVLSPQTLCNAMFERIEQQWNKYKALQRADL